MISGILRDRRQTTSHNSLTTKEVSESLLTSLVPEKVVEGNEGFIESVTSAIKNVIKKIIDGFKWLWNKLFGTGGDVKEFKKGLKELKGAKLNSEGLTFNKRILYFVKQENWGDPAKALKDLVETSGQLLKMAERIKENMTGYESAHVTEGFLSDSRVDREKKISSVYQITSKLTVKFSYDPADKANASKEHTVVEKSGVTPEEVKKNNGFFYISREAFEMMVKNLIVISDIVDVCEKKFEHIVKKWETHIKNFQFTDKFKAEEDSQSFLEHKKEHFTESARFLNAQFKLLKTLWIQYTKEIEEFKSLVESFTAK